MEQLPTAATSGRAGYPVPAMRRFRVYAFDPLASTSLETAIFNDAVISLPWEEAWEAPLSVGPSGEYLEVVDFDPASGLFYAPIDPNDPLLLAQDGLPPSEGRPQFHQQMAYAVAMKTIHNFERALGRKVLWSPLKPADGNYDALVDDGYVQKLRIYPHALREDNAYYSPDKKALLFGYFRAGDAPGARSLPGGWVFTCLSHDVIAHETTHAILDGIHNRFIEASTLDSLAFHEAFADTVALLQHFTMEGAVRHELAAHGGQLRVRDLLSGLAKQFADARGMAGALREGIDVADPKTDPVSGAYASAIDPHERGAFLVAAVFDAFVTIFERRSGDLMRMFANTTQPGADMHPDLVARLAGEAAKAADHMLRICVRALDYVPPVDLRFGEFLRAMITADADLVPDDPLRYRLAIAEAFRRRGIFPHSIASMAPDSLMWESPEIIEPGLSACHFNPAVRLNVDPEWRRPKIWRQALDNQQKLWGWLSREAAKNPKWESLLGIQLSADAPQTIGRSQRTGLPAVEVHSVRVARRAGPDGQDLRQLVIEVTQRRRAFLDPDVQAQADRGEARTDPTDMDFEFRGGCTMLVDLRDWTIRYAIRKNIMDDGRLQTQRDFRSGATEDALRALYFGDQANRPGAEPFAMLHRG
ncbi:hypothetical protein [Phenylobacterium sp.]|uniref:hypothetical protein n=1 Tax=Phenylobacterium sp. TaxID=1871053 RepID=UPI0025EEE9F2|nr:hypothetical protein [Phenylobacterium sp.]